MTFNELLHAQQFITQNFPRLRLESFQVTSPREVKYNCIAWAAEDDQNFWWPGGKYWPNGVKKDDSVAAFIAAFATKQYVTCANADLETGFQKVALYVDEQRGRVTHAARQLPDGRWTSKLGKVWDIIHSLEGVCGPHPAYGRVAQILRRPIPPQAAAS